MMDLLMFLSASILAYAVFSGAVQVIIVTYVVCATKPPERQKFLNELEQAELVNKYLIKCFRRWSS